MGYPAAAFAAQDRLIRAFTTLGATEPARAIRPDQLPIRWYTPTRAAALRRFLELGIAHRTANNRFYLDCAMASRLTAGRNGIRPWRLGS